MSRDELRLFSYEILGLVGSTGAGHARSPADGAAGTHARLGRREPVLRRAQAARALGYLEARKEPGKTRTGPSTRSPRKAGGAARVGADAGSFTPVKSELLVRLLIADLVGEAATREASSRCARTSPTCSRGSTRPRPAREALPHRRKYLLLSRSSCAACSSCTSSSSRGRARARPGRGGEPPDSGRG